MARPPNTKKRQIIFTDVHRRGLTFLSGVAKMFQKLNISKKMFQKLKILLNELFILSIRYFYRVVNGCIYFLHYNYLKILNKLIKSNV